MMQEGFDNRLFVKMILKRDDEVKMEKSFKIGPAQLKEFVSEAANILLQRIMIQQKKSGEINLSGLTNHGNVVKVNYVSPSVFLSIFKVILII